MKKNLLIIEDETALAKQLKWGLVKDYEISIASDAVQARRLLATGAFPVVTLDLGLPPYPGSPTVGFQLLQEMATLAPGAKVIVITGNAEEENAIKAIALGACDFCSKPIDLKILDILLTRAFRIYELEKASLSHLPKHGENSPLCGMLGTSPSMRKLFDLIRQAGATDYAVLITGESGTGKEMTARAVHAMSRRQTEPLVIINCGAIPANLLESELFGHEKGAFTGAIRRKIGRFERGDRGSIFLDEIGELPLTLQVKLLRFLQEGTIERVGGTSTIKLDVRVIAATNINLEQAVKEGAFRKDLYYRIDVVPLKVPPLRNRPEDVLLLAQHFLEEESSKLKRGQITFSPLAVTALVAHSWPGNVRELQNRIRRALTICDRLISPVDLGLKDAPMQGEESRLVTFHKARDQAEIKVISKAMTVTGNNITQAAKLLNISRPTLYDLLRKHGIAWQ